MDTVFEELKKKAHSLPLSPGVYLYSDKNDRVIYVGKARVLRNRVSQYFHPGNTHPKVRAMVSHARKLDYIVTASEYEALVLECSLIKQYQPCYNILLKDSTGRCFIRVDLTEPYPRFALANKIEPDKAEYFGPYFSRELAYSVIDSLKATFRLPVCSRVFPRDIGRERPCLHYQLKQCYGPCRKEAPQETYIELMKNAVMILGGKTAELEASLRAEMEEAAESLAFERAAELRDRIRALSILGQKQKVVTDTRGRLDVCGLYVGDLKSAVSVMTVNNGAITGQQITVLAGAVGDVTEQYASFLTQYYAQCDDLPERVLISLDFEDRALLTDLLTKRRGATVRVDIPQRGLNRQLLDMSEQNAKSEVLRTTNREDKTNRALSELANLLGTDEPPKRIEAYDISNTGDSAIVASMVVFVNGRPYKSAYRHYSIRGKQTQDDYYAMSEVISRRFAKAMPATMPDLVLIDGGLGQVHAALAAMRETGHDVRMLGMVKDDRHRTRALIDPDGNEIGLSATPICFSLITAIQDEAHRFALRLHQTRTKNETLTSALDRIHGIGEIRRAALLKKFRSLRQISDASMADLAEVVPPSAAKAVYDHFHPTPAKGKAPEERN